MSFNFEFNNGLWSFLREKDGAGWSGMMFEVNGLRSDALRFKFKNNVATGFAQKWREDIRFSPDGNSLVVERKITNTSDSPLLLEGVRDGILNGEGKTVVPGINEYFLRYAHSSNVRTEKFPMSRPDYPYWRTIPFTETAFNFDEANHFPFLMIGAEDMATLLVEGDLDQTRFCREWKLQLCGEQMGQFFPSVKAESRYPLAGTPFLEPGESMIVSLVFYQILENTHIQSANAGYLAELNRRYYLSGKKSAMLHGAMYCTWNYGIFHNIDENILLLRAAIIGKMIPECTHFMIDDGYQRGRKEKHGALDSFYPDPENGYDKKRFPSGMKAMAAKIRECKLVPGIWLSPTVRLGSRLADEHSEWLMADENGNPDLMGGCTYLDLSVNEAQMFFLRILDVLFVEWGYKALKFDFMTHWFTLERARFRNGGSGPYWRDWVFSEIRKRIGDDGVFLTCIAMSMGNPFVARFADAYRCGCDIHMCTWPEQLKAVAWSLPAVILPGRQNNLLNADSAGFGDCTVNERQVWLNWCFITQGIFEWGGKVEEYTDEEFSCMRKLLAHADRGHKVECLNDDVFTGRGIPKLLYVEYPRDSLTRKCGIKAHLALFNWSDEPMAISVLTNKLAGCSLADFWTGEKLQIKGNLLIRELDARSSEMWSVLA
ncbi:MAG: alpha-galactosidase [Lentisphaerota bacterium]